jgi:hypothetical protein
MILKIGTHGSFFRGNETVSISWVLIGNQNVLAHGAGPADGIPLVLCSTRAKLFGIAAWKELLHHFMIFHKIESTSMSKMCWQQSCHCMSKLNPTQVFSMMLIQWWWWHHHSNCEWHEALDSVTSIAVGESTPRQQATIQRTWHLGPPELRCWQHHQEILVTHGLWRCEGSEGGIHYIFIGGVENTVCVKTMCHTNFLCDRSINLLNDK